MMMLRSPPKFLLSARQAQTLASVDCVQIDQGVNILEVNIHCPLGNGVTEKGSKWPSLANKGNKKGSEPIVYFSILTLRSRFSPLCRG